MKLNKRLMELRKLVDEGGGMVTPERVVEHAKNPKSALHGAFTWDDTEAAHNWRIEQARRLLRVSVVVIDHPKSGEQVSVRAFFSPSLKGERGEDGSRAYQYVPVMLRTEKGRSAILETAFAEFTAFETKYQFLTELVPLFEAARRIKQW